MTNKELIALLQERGHDVKSASNTISNIYADSLMEELGAKKEEAPKEEVKKAPAPKKAEAKEAPTEEAKPAPKKPDLSKFVKSADDLTKEREQKSKPAPAPQPVKAAQAPKPPATPSVKLPTPPATPGAPKMPPPAAKAPKVPGAPAAVQATSAPEAAVADVESKQLQIKPPIVVRDFAGLIGLKPFRLISELMEMGIFASMNQVIEEEVACKIAQTHGFTLEVRHRGETAAEETKQPKKVKEEPKLDQEPRAPIVCVLGHVDHGKTTLLDNIRKANVVAGEAGGITQHIGAYQVENSGQKITFLDTPGHAAFSKMRERGANVTDIAILVVAADDGFMPQTEEALKFAQKSNVPVVVAINKMDAPGANADKVKQQMQQKGIAPEEWGGETLCASVAAIKGEGIDGLLESVLLQAEMLELQAAPKANPTGVIIESQVEVGRGSTATIIVQDGTLKVGDALVCGSQYCKVRAMMDDKGKPVKSAGPSTPVRLMGWSSAPEAGATFRKVKNEKEAKREAEECAIEEKKAAAAKNDDKPADLALLLSAIENTKQKTFHVFIKGDVHGSVEALKACLEEIQSEKVPLEVVSADVGPISKNDIIMASAAEAVVVGFNTKLENGVAPLAKHHNVRIIQHNIIYELITQVKEAMAELLEPELQESKKGAAQVRQVFPVSKGTVAGCMVTEGAIQRDAYARVVRGKEVLYEGKVGTLKRFKDDVNEVRAGYECGIRVNGFDGYKDGDVIECFEITKIAPSL